MPRATDDSGEIAVPRERRAPADRRQDARRADDNGGPFAGLPVWARIIAMLGIPGTLCFFLVWVGANYFPKMYAELVTIRVESEKARMVDERLVAQLELNYRLLQRICSNVAKNDEDRQRCFDR